MTVLVWMRLKDMSILSLKIQPSFAPHYRQTRKESLQEGEF